MADTHDLTVRLAAGAGFDPAGRRDAARLRRDRVRVSTWLFGICGMLLVMIALGGATRLTGSGLSIMEWAPVSGALPPLNHADWEQLFALYKQIPQYRLLHDGMGLAGFQGLFWLEWVHRLWGRLLGVAFLLPLLWFWLTGALERRFLPWLAAFFVLGGLQGAVGWFMVASGFEPDSTAVSPYRLVAHLALALFLYAAILWTGLSIRTPNPAPLAGRRGAGLARRAAQAAILLAALTIVAGGFMAGTHAGFTDNTFPLIDGQLFPAGYATLHPFLRNLAENITAVQFDHRLLATLTLLAAAAVLAIGLGADLPRATRAKLLVLGAAIGVQYCLGVATLLLVVPVALATLHQNGAVLVLTAALVALHALSPARDAQGTITARDAQGTTTAGTAQGASLAGTGRNPGATRA